MKTLGIIGGIAPPSTIDYYRQLTRRYRERSPDGAFPSIILNSISAQSFFEMLATGDRNAMIEVLLAELGRLERAGADVALFASNSPHLVFDEVARDSPLPLISIVEETAAEAEARGLKIVGLIGARFTMEGGFYGEVFGRRGISVVTPEPDDRTYIHDRYFGELVEGEFLAETRRGMAEIIERMDLQHGIQAVILGGTELPMLFRDGPPTVVPTLDTTMIHIEAAITRLLE